MRLFTAIDIPPEVKTALVAVVDRLRPVTDLRWISPEKLHITTKFFGEWSEDRLEEMKVALATVRSPGPIGIVINGLGVLPRVLYARVEPNEALTALAAATEHSVEGLGVATGDREYRPHVTLARARTRVPKINFEDSVTGSFRASSFALYLSASGKYTRLQEFSLNT